MSKLVILDRDGVINEESSSFIRSPEQWHPIPGSLEAMGKLTGAGFRIVIATNQSGIKRRLFNVPTLNQMHAKLIQAATAYGAVVEAIFFCPCLPRDNCDCYKPNPGMLNDIANRLMIELHGVPFIGDSLRDVQAARAAGAQPHLVLTGNGPHAATNDALGKDTLIHDDLAAAANYVIAHTDTTVLKSR